MDAPAPLPRIFLLSPARTDGERAKLLFNDRAAFDLARRIRERKGAPLGEVFAFLSGLYFRGKLLYARTFARGDDAVLVITPTRGLQPWTMPTRLDDLLEFSKVPIDEDEPRYREPLERSVKRLARGLDSRADAVILGSIATGKYVDVLHAALEERLKFPAAFVGRGDMSRGGLMLRCARSGEELEYVPITGARRSGKRPIKLAPVAGILKRAESISVAATKPRNGANPDGQSGIGGDGRASRIAQSTTRSRRSAMAKRRDEVVRIYEGLAALDAHELADRLNQAGIESFVDNTDSPLSGLTLGRGGRIVKVFRADLEAAQRIKRAFERDGRVGAPRDAGTEAEAEGMELSSDQRPSQDSPSNDIEGAGVERLDMSQPGAEAPEVEGLQLEEPGVPQEDVPADMIKGFGPDRPIAQDADVETDEIEEQQIDRLDVTPTLRERETATPAANLKGRMGVRTRGTAEQPSPSDAGTNDASERRGAVTRRPGGGVRATRSTSRTKRAAKSRSGGGKAQKQLREASKKQGGGRKSTGSSSSVSGKRMDQEERDRANPQRNASRRTAERARTKRG